MKLIGERVNHIKPDGSIGKFGTGTIVKLESSHIFIRFDGSDEDTQFAFPGSIGKYLELVDKEKRIEFGNQQNSEKSDKTDDKATSMPTGSEQGSRSLGSPGLTKPDKFANIIFDGSAPLTEDQTKRNRALNTAIQELNELVGLDDVKHEVNQLKNYIITSRLRRQYGFKVPVSSNHLVFTGNPGTGKTTVARIISEIYYGLGVTKADKLVCTDREGLVAGYVGQTAIKTQKVIDSAIGGVLFIDEAYSLSGKGENDFGKEAIDKLVLEMENKRNSLVVIVAGYTKPMKRFFELNPGLKSRFNKQFEFFDYKGEEMLEIFRRLCEKFDYRIDKSAENVLLNIFKNMYHRRTDTFGNARDVRNIFEKIIQSQSNRIAHSVEEGVDLTAEDIITINYDDLISVPTVKSYSESVRYGNLA